METVVLIACLIVIFAAGFLAIDLIFPSSKRHGRRGGRRRR
ncbi:MAG: hypothetical protein ACI3VK_00375 [Oscillospiraceae bacterium]